jgi:hypothetical protein
VLVAGVKAAFGVIVSLAGLVPLVTPGGVPSWVYAIVASTYTLVGAGLVVSNRGDVRAAWLGGLFVLIGAVFAPTVNAPHSTLPAWITYLRLEAFLAFYLWQFALVFPANITRGPARLIGAIAATAAMVGAACVAINLSAAIVDPAGGIWTWRLPWLYSTTTGNLYWPVVLGAGVPAYPVLLARGRAARPDERDRVYRFLWSLLAGLAPIAIEVVLEESFPAYKALVSRPDVKPWVAIALFMPLASVPFVTTYFVLFTAIVDVRVVLRSALQYALARYTIIGVTLVPFAALTLFVASHRDETLASLMRGLRPMMLGGTAALGLLTLMLRGRWLLAVDRRYFRDMYDAQQILTRFMAELPADSVEAISRRASQELSSSLYADVAVFIANDADTSLRDVDNQRTALSVDTPLVALMRSDSRPMDIDLNPSSALGRRQDVPRVFSTRLNWTMNLVRRAFSRSASFTPRLPRTTIRQNRKIRRGSQSRPVRSARNCPRT